MNVVLVNSSLDSPVSPGPDSLPPALLRGTLSDPQESRLFNYPPVGGRV